MGKISSILQKIGGFVAYYRDQIATSTTTLEGLMKRKEVKWFLGTEDLLSGHLAPEGMIVAYQNSMLQEAKHSRRSV